METASEPIIEIRNLILSNADPTRQVDPIRLAIHRGEMAVIGSDDPLDGRHLLRVLATLDQPWRGKYRFKGKRVEMNRYRQCLGIKRQIGYVATDAALISNRTLRENLLLMRFYHENDLNIDLDETVRNLCNEAALASKLDQRPAALSGTELLKAVAIREIAKSPAVMLLENPETFLEAKNTDGLFQQLKKMRRKGSAVVFSTNDSKLAGLANRRLTLVDGQLQASPT